MLQPLGFFARPLANDRERSMSARHLERRALIGTLHKFSDILQGQKLVVRCITDHKGLQSLKNNSRDGTLSKEEATELQFFNRWRITIAHAPGESPMLATSDLLSRNLPTHADDIGSFRGGGDDRRWGTGDFSRDVGFKDDVTLNSLTPDDTSTLQLRRPALEWDGPAMDTAGTDIAIMQAPDASQCAPCEDSTVLHIPGAQLFARVPAAETAAYSAAGWTAPRCICHFDCEAGNGRDLFNKTVVPVETTEKLGTVDPLSAQVKSAPNIIEPNELALLKYSIVYKLGTFACKIWD